MKPTVSSKIIPMALEHQTNYRIAQSVISSLHPTALLGWVRVLLILGGLRSTLTNLLWVILCHSEEYIKIIMFAYNYLSLQIIRFYNV